MKLFAQSHGMASLPTGTGVDRTDLKIERGFRHHEKQKEGFLLRKGRFY